MSDATKIQNPSITPKDFTIQDNKIIAISGIPVSGAGGTTSDYVYYPSYDETNGNITFTLGTIQGHPVLFGPYHISGAPGEQGASGYTPEFRINSDNKDHWEWKYTEDSKWHDLGIAASGIEGPRGPQGVPGQNGKSVSASVDAIEGGLGYLITLRDGTSTKSFRLYSPTVSTEVIPSGNRVTFAYAGSQSTHIDVMSGVKGDTGTSGISPIITTATIDERDGHPQGGTEVTVTDIDHPVGQTFIVWNGTDGQGATVELNGGNGIEVTNISNEYFIAVSADYATKAYAEEASAAAYHEALTAIPSLDDYYHKSETSGANEIATALEEKLNTVDLPNYDGENGIYVDDSTHKIGISADYKAQIEAVSGKLTSPATAVDVDDYRIYDANGQTWAPLDDALTTEGVLLKQNLNTVLNPTNGISGNYNNSEYTFGLSAEYENAIKAVSGKVNAPPADATGKKVYNASYSSWDPFDLDIPMKIGDNNSVTDDSIGVIGKNCTVGPKSMAISYEGATARNNSMAFGDSNYASANSMAAGWGVKATDYSVIFGHGTTNNPSEVKNFSFAAGDAVFAYNYSQAFGRGLVMSGSNDIGGMAIGGWNRTSADALFVAGNGTDNSRSDALILYRDGSLSAAGKISAAGIELGAEPDLSDYIPYSAIQLPIGTNNDVSNYSMGIGYANTANYGDVTTNQVQYGSLAFGYENNAGKMSFAAGNGNTAYHVGFAVGYHCSANEHAVAMNNNCTAYDYAFAAGNNCNAGNYSFAEGNGTSAYNRSFAAGEGSTATDHSFAFGLTQCYANQESFVVGNASTADAFSFAYGPSNKAYKHSYVIGRGLEFSGAGTGGYYLGAFVVGGWNATKSWSGPTASSPLFIVGNGTGNDNLRSDAMIVYRDGNVSAKTFQNADGTDTINGTTYSFSGVDNIEILPLAVTAYTANFPNDNVLRFILES